jgi:competence protein ComEC
MPTNNRPRDMKRQADSTANHNAAGDGAVYRPAVWMAVSFIAGLLSAHGGYGIPPWLAFGVAILLISTSWFLVHRRHQTTALACILLGGAAMGNGRITFDELGRIDTNTLSQVLNEEVVLTARITSDAVLSGRSWRFGVTADTVRSDTFLATGRIPLWVRVDTALVARSEYTSGYRRLRHGVRVQVTGKLRQPRATTPGLFDYSEYLERQGYAAVVSAWSEGCFTVLARDQNPWEEFWSNAREYVRRTVTVGAPPDQAALLTALLLGDRSGIPIRVMDTFQASGVVHVLAVSGLHVGIVLFLPWLLVRRFGSRTLRYVLPIIVFAWFYAALSGMNPPVVRASIMATVLLLTVPTRRIFDPWNTLALSALITLAIHPSDLLGASFQLSYVAMIGIFWMADWLQGAELLRRFERLRMPYTGWRVGSYVAGLICMTIAAQLVTWPVTAHYFGRVSFIGIALSPIVVALVTLSVWGGMLTTAFGWIPGLAETINAVISPITSAVLALPEWAALIPAASQWVRPPNWIEIAAYFAILFAVWKLLNLRKPVVAILLGILLFANLWAWSEWAHRRTATEIVFLDVGQGDATLCVFENGATILIDGGARTEWFDAGAWVIVPYLRSRGIWSLDAVIATHPDNDHIGGLGAVLSAFDVRMLIHNGVADSRKSFRNLIEMAEARGTSIHAVAAGDSLIGISARILSPPGSAPTHLWSPNDRSIVLRIEDRGHSVLIAGDAGKVAEERMGQRWGDTLQSDVLKLGHHGSATSSSERFLAAVDPAYAIVSAGRDNVHRHPAQVVMNRISDHGIVDLSTAKVGTIIWRIESDTTRWITTLPTTD